MHFGCGLGGEIGRAKLLTMIVTQLGLFHKPAWFRIKAVRDLPSRKTEVLVAGLRFLIVSSP